MVAMETCTPISTHDTLCTWNNAAHVHISLKLVNLVLIANNHICDRQKEEEEKKLQSSLQSLLEHSTVLHLMPRQSIHTMPCKQNSPQSHSPQKP